MVEDFVSILIYKANLLGLVAEMGRKACSLHLCFLVLGG